jgi:hypothetical protein
VGNFTWTGRIRNAYNIFAWKHEWNTPHGVCSKICSDNMKTDPERVDNENVNWIHVVQDWPAQWYGCIDIVLNITLKHPLELSNVTWRSEY